jgi:hypothetical protein
VALLDFEPGLGFDPLFSYVEGEMKDFFQRAQDAVTAYNTLYGSSCKLMPQPGWGQLANLGLNWGNILTGINAVDIQTQAYTPVSQRTGPPSYATRTDGLAVSVNSAVSKPLTYFQVSVGVNGESNSSSAQFGADALDANTHKPDGVFLFFPNGVSNSNFNVSGAVAGIGSTIKITTSAPHGFSIGQSVVISGIVGTTEANGSWAIVNDGNFSTTAFDIAVTFQHAYSSGGSVTLSVHQPLQDFMNHVR